MRLTMRLTSLVTLTLASISASHCSDAEFAGGRVGRVDTREVNSGDLEAEPKTEDTLPDERTVTSSGVTATLTKTFDLKVSTTENSKKKDEPIELLFLLDNSQSMADNVKKLSDSVGKLFEDFNTAKIPYRARIVPIDLLNRVLEEVPDRGVMAPPKAYSGMKSEYNREAQHEEIYIGVEPFTSLRSSSSVAAAIEESTEGTILFDNEPLICGALDYVNWASFTDNALMKPYKFAKNQKLHIVALSDENNDTVIESIDRLTGEITGSKDLVCYKEGEMKRECSRKYYADFASWTGYGYQWRELGYNRYKYTVSYETGPSTCVVRNSPVADDDEVRLFADKKCQKERIHCRDKDQASYSPRYSCAIGADAPSIMNSDLQAANSGRCSVAQRFKCEHLVDGSKVWQEVDRAAALDIISRFEELDLACEPILTGTSTTENVSTNSLDYNNEALGFHSCEAWTCEAAEPVVSYPIVTLDKVDLDANPSRYIDDTSSGACNGSFWSDYHADGFFIYKPETSGGKFTGLTERSCASVGPRWETRTVGLYRISNSFFCEGVLGASGTDFAAAGITFRDRRDSRPPRASMTRTYSAQQTHAQVISDLGLNGRSGIVVSETHETQADTIVTRYYTYDRSAELSGLPGFAVIAAADDSKIGPQRERVGTQAFLDNPPMNGDVTLDAAEYAAKGVTIQRTEDPNGEILEEVCSDPVIEMTEYKPTPENFVKLMDKLHPTKAVTWHSIVNMDAKSCANAGETNVSKGSDYLDLAQKTQGLHADICEPNFADFVDKLAYEVITEVDLFYDLPEEASGKEIKSAFNKTTNKNLKFTVVDTQIRFEKGSISEGDAIVVSY